MYWNVQFLRVAVKGCSKLPLDLPLYEIGWLVFLCYTVISCGDVLAYVVLIGYLLHVKQFCKQEEFQGCSAKKGLFWGDVHCCKTGAAQLISMEFLIYTSLFAMCSYASTILHNVIWILRSDLWTVSTENSENFTNCNSGMFLAFFFLLLFLPKIKSCHFKLWANLGFIFSSKGFLCSHSWEICLSICPEGSGHLLQIK